MRHGHVVSGRTRAQQARHRQRRRRRLIAAGIVAVLVLGLGVVLSWGGDTAAPGVEVSLTEYAFSPDPIEPTDGRLHLTNDGAIGHNLVVIELGKGSRELAPGESQTLDLSEGPAGTYTVVCDLTGHREEGMETTLVLS
jgi:plastocyanin